MLETVRAESVQCIFCTHLSDNKGETGEANTFTCAAYPSGIPEDILLGIRIHDKVFDDQQGSIVYEETEDIP